MIKYQTQNLTIEIDGQGSDYGLDACLKAVKELITMPIALTSGFNNAVIPGRNDNPPYVLLNKPTIDGVPNPRIDVTSSQFGVERSMKTRIPNVVDMKTITFTKPDTAEGFRCPSCHQSMFLYLGAGKSDTKMIMRTEDGIKELDGVRFTFKDDQEYAEQVNDEAVAALREHLIGEKLVLVKGADTICECPRCAETGNIDIFIDEFNETTSEFEHPCDLCGGEVVPRDQLQEDKTMLHLTSCEKCGSSNQF